MQRRRRRRWIFFPLGLIVTGVFFPAHSHADLRVAPEFALYVTHNTMFRSRFVTNGTWRKEASDFTTAGFEYGLDIGFLSFFRRYIFKDPNFEKSKRLSIRLGYSYYPDLTTGDTSVDEKRFLGEFTMRFPLGPAWLLTDRNRGELRRVGEVESGRYRNRLRMERNVIINKFRMTPYANAEVYYDSKPDQWNQVDGTLGAEFPWRYKTILEFYFTYQFMDEVTDNQVIGLTLQKHL